MKTIIKKYSNGTEKVIELGKEDTCVLAEPYGWGTSCKNLVLKPDGYYRCDDCGLAFKKPILKEKLRVAAIECDCKELVNFLEWYFNEFYGYDCPLDYYKCQKCKRVYEAPHYSREAPLKFQESEAAKQHIKRRRESNREEQRERVRGVKEDIESLKANLSRLPRKERNRLLKGLRG